MQVDDEGMDLYVALVRELLRSQELMVPETNLLRPDKQLLIFHFAAKLHDLRESIMSFWRAETMEGLVEPFLSTVRNVKQVWQDQGKWTSNVRVKKVFGHSAVVKFCPTMPNFPNSSNGSFVFLQQRPGAVEPGNAGDGGIWNFAQGAGKDPVTDLETKGLALVLCMDSFVKDAVVLCSPFFQHGKSDGEELSKLILKEPDLWRRLLKTESQLFSPQSATLIKQVLRPGVSTITPRKPRPATEDETPEKEKEKPKKARNEELAQQGYATLLEKVLEELDFFTEPFQGLRWLENKKQLLVYHYAARMNEQKDAILQAISSNEEVKDLDPIYQRAAHAVRDELVGLFEGQKMKKMFSHDHVIRFHSLKGVPVHRECCVFLRERPQCSSDILRKTPSIFRDLIRYRGQTSPLMELEHHHLALVLTVTDRNPRAWLVISPLLAKPELLEKVSSCTWPEIKEKLQDELTSLIRHESDVWRGFIQRHADMVSKESLKIIQKVLKGCQPGASVGEFSIQTARFAEDVDEANEARELAEMRFAEAEQRWDMSAQLEVATVEEKRLDAEQKVKKLSSMERRLKIRVHLQALRLKAKKEDDLEEERQAAEAQMESLRKSHRDDLSRVQRDADELKRALDREQVRCIQLKEEATLLEESKQELLQAIAKLDAEERKDRRQWRTKNAVLKQHLKQGKQQQKELVAKMTAEAEAKVAEVQTAMTQEASQLRAALLEAQQAQRSSFAQLEVQSATLQRTGQLNTELRSSAAKAEDDARMAREAAAAAVSSREEARCQVETLQKEVQLAKETTQKELAEAEAKHKKGLWEMKRLQGDYDDLLEEVALASKTCDSLRVDAAKATLVEKEKAVLEEQLRKATMAQAEAVKRIQSLELLEKELQETLKQREAELNNKMETLAKLQERNRSLQVAAAEATEKEQEAKGQLLAAQEKLGLETSTALAAQGALAEAQQAKDQAMEENLKAQELQRMAEAKCKEAIAQQLDAQHQCTQAQQAFAAVEQRELRAKAELISQSQEAHRLTEKCVSLSHEKAELEQKLQQKLLTHEQVEQSLMAKQAELQVTQDALKTLQESNRTLRDERATACAASEEALRLATEAQRLVEVAKTQRQSAEAKAAESIKNATAAEEKLQEVEQRFSKIESERESLAEQVSKLRRSCAVKEAEVAKAKDDERKATMKLAAQVQEAQRLSSSCATLKGHLVEAQREVLSATCRAEQAEAERAVALSASELSEEDVRRLAKERPQEDTLIKDLEAALEAPSPNKKVEQVEQVSEAPSKKQRLEGGVGAPMKRIRFKSPC